MKRLILIIVLFLSIECNASSDNNKYNEYLEKALTFAEADGGQRQAKIFFRKAMREKRRELRWKEIATLSK